MARNFAAQGGGHLQRPTADNSPAAWQEWPYIVIIGASGQIAQLLPPSGFATKIPDISDVGDWHSHECSLAHSNLAWKRNKLIAAWSETLQTVGSMRPYAWNPQPQEAEKTNPNPTFTVDTNTDIADLVVADGYNWELWTDVLNRRDFGALLPIHDAILWRNKLDEVQEHFGLYKGNEPERQSDPTYSYAAHGALGNVGDAEDEGWSRLPGSNAAGGVGERQEGVSYDVGNYPTNLNFNICEMIRHNDTFYYATQYAIAGFTLGCKGNFIHHDYTDDSTVAVGSITGYQSRSETNQLKARPRSLSVFEDKIWMLDNDGKVFEIRPGGIIQKADLTTLGTAWSSGIFGGQINRTPLAGNWPGATAYRPLLRSFNKQLHAFLNFRTTFNIADGKGSDITQTTGHGICWFTSHDGVNWSDRTEMLPSSGIITPSGNGAPLGSWLAEISPWKFSALQSTNFPSGYGAQPPEVNPWSQSAPEEASAEGQPSGFKQIDKIPFWASGQLNDAPFTTFDALDVPLQKGALSGHLFPTLVNYPSGYAGVDPASPGATNSDGVIIRPTILDVGAGGEWRAIGQGARGYDYTGCSNYHIAGLVDEDDSQDQRLRLYFSRNFDGGDGASAPQVPTLFFDLTTSSGFIQKNEAWKVGQLNGYIPIELHDPEVIVPSGDLREPNPFIMERDKMVRLQFITTDWGFWEPVDVKIHYSLDGGQNWLTPTISGFTSDLSTGSPVTDPSGMGIDPNQKHTVYWLYDRDISKNEFFPRVQLRIRAERD
jgi:hypothetical protein